MKIIWPLYVVVFVGLLFAAGCGKKSGIEGKVVDGKGRPMGNVKIIANQVQPIKGYEHFETTTSSDGIFRFKGLFPTFEYILFAWGESLEPQTKMIVKSGQEGQISMLSANMVIGFTTPKDGVITDTTTGLQWAQDAGHGGMRMTWNQANVYVQNLKIGGISGWRLPSVDNLGSLFSYCKSNGTSAKEGECVEYYNKIGFKNVQSDYYWSSTAYANSPNLAWIVGMWNGNVDSNYKSNSSYDYVWPVRSGQ